MDKQAFLEAVSTVRNGSFLYIDGYQTNEGKVSSYLINFKISYKSLLERSLDIMLNYTPNDAYEAAAREELMASWIKSLSAIDAGEFPDDAYERYFDENGKYIPSVKLHREDNILHITGLLVSMKIIIEGPPKKPVKSSEKTLAKQKLTRLTPVSKFCQFRLSADKLNYIVVSRKEFII